MKVLTFLTSISLRSGGPSRSVPLLVKGLSETGLDVTLMTYRSEDMNTHALEGTDAKLKVLEHGTSPKEIEQYIVNEGFDIIQLQSIWDLRYHMVARIARKYRIPYIITPRGMLEPWSLSQNSWKKKIGLWCYQLRDLNKAAGVYATAEMEAKHVRDLGIKIPIAIINNGIETEDYSCRTTMDVVKKQVLFLSRLHVKKGIELLIEAWKGLKTDFPDWQLLIVGNGEEEYVNSLQKKVSEAGLTEMVKVMPPVFGKAKHELYCESALFCLPSFSENFGMVVAEALSCGVPVITTNDTPWQILNWDAESKSRTGWCIDLSVANLEKTLREAMSLTPSILYEMGQKGSELVYNNFNYHSVADKTKDFYNWVLRKKNKPLFIYD